MVRRASRGNRQQEKARKGRRRCAVVSSFTVVDSGVLDVFLSHPHTFL